MNNKVMTAYNKRNIALRKLYFKRHREIKQVLALLDEIETHTEELIKMIAERRSNPPEPKQQFNYDGKTYRLQTYLDGNATYVVDSKWKSEEYIFDYPDKRERIRNEVSVSNSLLREILETPSPLHE